VAFFVGLVLSVVMETVVIVEGVSAIVAEVNHTLCDEIHIIAGQFAVGDIFAGHWIPGARPFRLDIRLFSNINFEIMDVLYGLVLNVGRNREPQAVSFDKKLMNLEDIRNRNT
jgi:hypothetical protein